MQRLEVSGAVRPLYGSLGFKGLMKIGFLDRFAKNVEISDFMKISPMGGEQDGRTDKANGRYSRS
jgi:hypothetical protein